jgi:flagellar basal body-associated protein FliL
MKSDLDNLLRTFAQAFASGRGDAGEIAWLLLGVMMVASIVALVTLYVWILRGGLSRQRFFPLSQSMSAFSELKED